MKKFTEKLKKYIENYMDWLYTLPDALGVSLLLFSVIAPIVISSMVIMKTMDARTRGICLDSYLPRRYKEFVCEEYHNGEWAKTKGKSFYFYNEPASKLNEKTE